MRKKRELKLVSSLESMRIITEFSERISDEYFLNDSYFGNIVTCLTEAVENAIIHGNNKDESKVVLLLMEEMDEGLKFTVIDQGNGFDTAKHSLRIPEDHDGKGLYLIHSLADDVKMENEGRVISMLFRITGIDQKVAEDRRQMLEEYRKSTHKLSGWQMEDLN